MKLLEKFEISKLVLNEFIKGNTIPGYINVIKLDQMVSYIYYKCIDKNQEVRDAITDRNWKLFEKNSEIRGDVFIFNSVYVADDSTYFSITFKPVRI